MKVFSLAGEDNTVVDHCHCPAGKKKRFSMIVTSANGSNLSHKLDDEHFLDIQSNILFFNLLWYINIWRFNFILFLVCATRGFNWAFLSLYLQISQRLLKSTWDSRELARQPQRDQRRHKGKETQQKWKRRKKSLSKPSTGKENGTYKVNVGLRERHGRKPRGNANEPLLTLLQP